ncbi:uncharacterized protein LOC132050652 [Lycium ferocissimum]|uniref:uncharacterized protein LOC132050652 n=1 Tax=Lycium ferocissimum TaxID=112874 RepID=UPI002815A674|nr:uncharacterized protein LOC132050652 [Lycium ferocissimum]
MEILSVSTNLSSWSRRRGYEKLNGSGRRRRNRVEYERRRFWKINLKPRLKLKLKLKRFSPKKLLLNIRDAYMNLMLKIANSRCMSSGLSGFGGDYNGFGVRQLKEYDEKVLVEIYKSMVIAQGQLVSRDRARTGAAKFGTEIMCQQ